MQLRVLGFAANTIPARRFFEIRGTIELAGVNQAQTSRGGGGASFGGLPQQSLRLVEVSRNCVSDETERCERNLGLDIACVDGLLEPCSSGARVRGAAVSAEQGVRKRDLAGGDAFLGRNPEPLRGGLGVPLDAVASRVKTRDIMRRERIALLWRIAETNGPIPADLRQLPRQSR